MLVIKPAVIEVLQTIFDPEIPVNIYELGLIYDIIVDASAVVGIKMTLTAPACPAAQTLPVEVEQRVRGVAGVSDVRVEIVWDPPWDKDRMSDIAKLALGIF
jgi:FeS assembly SUF system protein